MKCVDDFRLRLGGKEYVPIVTGGMGVDISTAELSLVAARLGGIGHISDAMAPAVSDRRFETTFVKNKVRKNRLSLASSDKTEVHFDLHELAEATRLHVGRTMDAKRGDGLIFVNCMEKLSMNNPRETLKVRLESAMDAGVDGITLSAGLHLATFGLIRDHPRFHHCHLGVIVSSARALKLFLRRAMPLDRPPSYVVVEGPLAGGHLGFGADNWRDYDLRTIVADVLRLLEENGLDIPVVPAGGVFTGTDATRFLAMGASAVQVATRFTVTRECGLPGDVQQEYLRVEEHEIEVNNVSPTGYAMRMIKSSPAIGAGTRPNCEAYGYLLRGDGSCSYIDSYNRAVEANPGVRTKDLVVADKTCLCTHMRNFTCWTCGQNAYRLKDTTHRLADGRYQLLDAEHVFRDYQFSKDQQIKLPPRVDTATGALPVEADAETCHDSASLCLSDQPR